MALIKKQTLLSTYYSYLSAVIGLVTQGYVIPTYFKTEENGLINILLSLMMLFPVLANLGFNGAGTRFFPYFRDKASKNHGYLFLAFSISSIGFLILLVGLFSFKPYIIREYQHKSALFVEYYYYLIPLVGSMLVFNIFDIYSRLHYDSVTGTFLSQFVLRLNNLAVALLYALRWIDFKQFMIIWTMGVSIPMVVMVAKTIREGNFSLRPDFQFLRESNILRPMLQFCAFAVVASISSQVVLYIDKIMINDLIDLKAVGVYSTAAFFGTVIAMPMVAMQQIASTVVAEAWKSNDTENIKKIYTKSCLVQLAVGLWVFIGVCANLHNIFEFLTPEYRAGKMVIVWIGLSKVIDMATGINGTILNTSKYYYIDTIMFILLGFCTVLLNSWLIPIWGIEGAAMGALIAVFIYNLCRYLLIWYLFGFQPFSYKNLVIILIGILSFMVVSILPILSGNKLLTLIDMAYRSIILTALFIGTFVATRYSEEFNTQLFGILKNVSKRLRIKV